MPREPRRSPEREPTHLPDKPRMPFADKWLLLAAFASGGMLTFAAPELLGNETMMDTAKAVLIGVSGGGIAYAVGKMAIDSGTVQAARNIKAAAFFSLGSILLTGTALATSTYAGLTMRAVDSRILSDFGTQVDGFVQARIQESQATTQTAAALGATSADFAAKAACEVASSCVSGRGNGRRGPVARLLEERAARAAAIAAQFTEGQARRDRLVGQLGEQLGTLRQAISAGGVGTIERRGRLQQITSSISQNTAALADAVPAGLAKAYAAELAGGANVPGNGEATQRLSDALRQHAAAIQATLPPEKAATPATPVLPPRPGVSDTFSYIGTYLPIALIAVAVDLILPAAIWLYAFWGLCWVRFCRDQPAKPDDGRGAMPVRRDEEERPSSPEPTSAVTPLRRGRKPAGDA